MNRRTGTRATAVAAVTCGLLATLLGSGPASADVPSPTSTATPTDTPSAPSTGGSATATGTATATTTAPPTTTSPTATPTATTPTSAPALTSAPGSPTGASQAPTTEPRRATDSDGPLSADQVQAQLAQARALAAQRRATDAGLQAAFEQLQGIGLRMSGALAELASAQDAAAQADRDRRTNELLLATMRDDLTGLRDAMGQWARETYAIGGPLAAYEGWLVALEAPSTGEVAHNLSVLQAIGVAGGKSVLSMQNAVRLQADTERRSALAAAQAEAARTAAEKAVDELKALQLQARLATARLRIQQVALIGSSRMTARQQSNLAAARALLSASGAQWAAGARCAGAPTSAFPNGAIPTSALCPVWGAPGQLLRADAAAAFGRLSQQYAQEFGRALCVTDSYRSLAAQVKVYAAKPTLAARPGTSNHGRGTAVDLCGGVESFGTADHAWMLAHAPLFGWFHPPWAEPAGPKPEPWHWEFAG